MHLSTRGKYGLYAMVYLAQKANDGPQTLREIAGLGLPDHYLEQLLGNLRKAGLVKTSRGASGGYQLAREASLISVGDVIDAMEGPVRFSECTEPGGECPRSEMCPTKCVWEYLTRQINQLLCGVSLKDMLEPEKLKEMGQ